MMNGNCFPNGVCKLIVDYLPKYTLLPWINKSKLGCFTEGKNVGRNIKSNVRAGDFLIDEYLELVRYHGGNVRDYLRAIDKNDDRSSCNRVCDNGGSDENRRDKKSKDIKINIINISCDNADKLINVINDVRLLIKVRNLLTHIDNDIIWQNYDLLINNNNIFDSVTDEKLIERVYNDYVIGGLLIDWVIVSRQNNPLANRIIINDYYNNNGENIYWGYLCENDKNNVAVDLILNEYKKDRNSDKLDWDVLCESDNERIVNIVIDKYKYRDGKLKISLGRICDSLNCDEYLLSEGKDEEENKNVMYRGRMMKLNFMIELYLETPVGYMLEVLFHIKDNDINDELANHMVEKHKLYFSREELYEEGENEYVYWWNFYGINNDIICNYLVSIDILDDEQYSDDVKGIYNNKNSIVVNYIKDRFYTTGEIHWGEISHSDCALYNSIVVNEYYYNNGRRLDWYYLCGDDCDEIVNILVHEGKWNNGARLKYKVLYRNKNRRAVELLRNVDEGMYITRSGFQKNPSIFEKIGGDVFDILMSLCW